MGMVAYLCVDCWCRYCHHTFMYHKCHVKNTPKRCNLDRLKSGSRRDTNETPTCARPTDERSLVRGTGGHNQGSFVYFAKGCDGWVFAGVNGVG